MPFVFVRDNRGDQGFMRSQREEGAEQGWEPWRLMRLGPIFLLRGR
jgi:hypothetical protein